jgi:tRNA (guanine26-N2/guanine27-N2)-dimethyltransferase
MERTNPQVLNRFSKVYTAERQATFDKKRAKRAVSKAAADAKAKAEGGGAAGEGGVGAGAATAGTEKEERPIADGPPKLLILEALSATGLRSVRYWNEIANVDKIISNDFSEAAVELIRRNVVHNGINPETEVVPSQGDATLVMHQHRASEERLFDVIDLDPYGGANPFLDAAVQSVAEGGMLCITCTDMAVLAGNHPEACFAKYASMPIRGKHCKESALRIMLSSVAQHAARYKRYIVPCLSLSIDFYSRIFVRVYTSANEVKKVGNVTPYLGDRWWLHLPMAQAARALCGTLCGALCPSMPSTLVASLRVQPFLCPQKWHHRRCAQYVETNRGPPLSSGT